jgi:hypothetical protein
MNRNILRLRNNQQGGVDSKVETEGQYSYLARIDTLLGPTQAWQRNDQGFPIQDEKGNYLAFDFTKPEKQSEVEISYDYKTREVTLDRINQLPFTWGMEDLTTHHEFLLYWRKRHRRAHSNVKHLLTQYLSAVPDTDNYFTTLSDSIGLIARSADYVDTSVVPLIDIDFTMLGLTPTCIHPVIEDKVDQETQFLNKELSLKTNTMFRRHQSHMLRGVAGSTVAHGEDMVNDYLHWKRMIQHQTELESKIGEVLGKVYLLLGYIRNAPNEQTVGDFKFNLAVENSFVKVDMLRNKFNTLRTALTSRNMSNNTLGRV